LFEYIQEHGIRDFLSCLSDDILEDVYVSIIGPISTFKRSTVLATLLEETIRIGLDVFFSTFSVNDLQMFAHDAGIKTGQSASKQKLCQAIVLKKDIKKSKKKAVAPKISKKKPALRAGVTYHDVFQHYDVKSLVSYCRKNNLKVSGTKKELIKRILLFLETGEGVVVESRFSRSHNDEEEEEEEDEEDEEDEEEEEDEEIEKEAPEEEAEDDMEVDEEEEVDIVDKVFYFTGFSKEVKQELSELISSCEGKVATKLTSATDFVIAKDIEATSATLEKARKLNIDIEDEDFVRSLDTDEEDEE